MDILQMNKLQVPPLRYCFSPGMRKPRMPGTPVRNDFGRDDNLYVLQLH
jgi:hypothetical protein